MLTKISMWRDQHGWQHITADEAATLYPYGLSKDSRIFLCEICNQYAALAKGTQRTFFTHTRDSGDCEQKTISYSTRFVTNPLEFSLPLRIRLINNKIDISIGFLPLPPSIMSSAEKANAKVSILVRDKNVGTYNISPLRFDPNKITYYSVNDNISEQYRLSYGSSDTILVNRFKYYWPMSVDGINRDGTLFDIESGKRLPTNADVVVGREYLLITQWIVFSSFDVHIEELCVIGQHKAYKVYAMQMSSELMNSFEDMAED